MRRLLVTGTSHVASLKAGWDTITDRPDGLEVDFLAANSTEYAAFSMNSEGIFGLHDGSVVPPKQAELARVFSGTLFRRIADFSHVVIAGHNFGASAILRMLSAHRVDQIRETDHTLPRLSQSAYRAFSLSFAMQQCPEQLISAFGQHSKVGVAPSPRLSETILTDPDAKPWFHQIAAHPIGIREAMHLADRTIADACAVRGATHFAPPDSCLAPSGFSRAEYSRGFVRFSGGKKLDHTHMNADYGAIRMRAFLDWALS